MGRLLSQQVLKARKDHRDDSADWIINGLLDCAPCGTGLTFSEWREIAKLKANDWKIKKGQSYVRQWNESDGSTYTFKTLPEILKICLKHKLYAE